MSPEGSKDPLGKERRQHGRSEGQGYNTVHLSFRYRLYLLIHTGLSLKAPENDNKGYYSLVNMLSKQIN